MVLPLGFLPLRATEKLCIKDECAINRTQLNAAAACGSACFHIVDEKRIFKSCLAATPYFVWFENCSCLSTPRDCAG
jgi:hypothetical protein